MCEHSGQDQEKRKFSAATFTMWLLLGTNGIIYSWVFYVCCFFESVSNKMYCKSAKNAAKLNKRRSKTKKEMSRERMDNQNCQWSCQDIYFMAHTFNYDKDRQQQYNSPNRLCSMKQTKNKESRMIAKKVALRIKGHKLN